MKISHHLPNAPNLEDVSPTVNSPRVKTWFSMFLITIFIFCLGQPALIEAATGRYVAAGGIDAGDCSDILQPCATIGYAISQAYANETVMVGEGIYQENILIDKPIILQGSGPETTILDGDTDADGSPNGNVITINVRKVIVTGFEIRNGYHGIAGQTSMSAIANNIIHDNWQTDLVGAGIYLWGDNNQNAIQGNVIYGNAQQGIFIGFANRNKVSNDNLISNNVIYGNGRYTDGKPPTGGEYGIVLWNTDTSIIEYNEVFGHNTGANGYGISLTWSKGNFINNNDVHDNRYGIAVNRQALDNYLAANVIHDNEVGVTIYNAGLTETLVNFNQFCRNTAYGLQNMGFAEPDVNITDATYNWWGSASGPSLIGPGSGDKVSAGVDFIPWEMVPPSDGPCHMNSVYVLKYHDLDQSGDQGLDEPGLNGWQMTLYDDQGQAVMSETTQQVGPLDGWALLEGMSPGDYMICETPQYGWGNTDPGTDEACKPITIADYGRMPGTGPLFAFIDHDGDDAYRLSYLGINTFGLDPEETDQEQLMARLAEPWLCLLAQMKDPDPMLLLEQYPELDPNMLIQWDPAEGFEDGLYYKTVDNDLFTNPIELGIKTWRGRRYSTATAFIQCGSVPTVAFGNYELPGTITIVEQADPANGVDFTFTSDFGEFILDNAEVDDGDAYINEVTFADVPAGTYSVTELLPFGWSIEDISCETNDAEDTTSHNDESVFIDLDPMEEVTCTFTNLLHPPEIDAGEDITVEEGEVVSFSGSYLDPRLEEDNGQNNGILWNFGDGSTAEGTLTPTHIYGDNGEYLVTLAVTDVDNVVYTSSLIVTVTNVAPTLEMCSNQTVQIGELVHFSASASDAGYMDSLTIVWDFGDGMTESGTLTPTHMYEQAGVYIVTLTVTDDDGSGVSEQIIVTINQFVHYLPLVSNQ